MSRLAGYVEDLSESTYSGSTFTKASVTVDLTNGVTYALVWSYQVGSDDTTSIARIRCIDSTGSASLGLHQFRARDTTDYPWAGGLSTYTAAATASRTFHVEFTRVSGSGAPKIKSVRLLILALGTEDGFGSAVANQTTTSTSFVDATTATFTPASTGDYLFIAAAAVTNGATAVELQTPGAVSVNTTATTIPYSAVYQPWAVVWREDGLAASSQTARLRWRSTAGTTQNMQAAAIVAIRLDAFQNVQTTQDDGADGDTDTSYTATESLAATGLAPATQDTLVFAAALVSNNSLTESSFIEFRDAGSQIIEGIHELGNAALTTSAGLIGYKPTASSSSITFDLRRKSEATNTTTVQFAAIALLGLAVTGAASITEAGDSLSSTSSLSIAGAASITEAADSVSSTIAYSPILADASITEANDSVSASGTLAIAAAASITEANDSLSGTGELDITASGSATEADDSLSAAGTLDIFGASDLDEADDAISAAGFLAIFGAADLVEADDSVTANDFVPRGRADLYEDDDHLIFAGGISAGWMLEQATKGDIPNWNHCARCHKEVRPGRMFQQVRRVGSASVWTGLYVCSDCFDPIHPQDRWPRKIGGDPRPVPNARPWRGG